MIKCNSAFGCFPRDVRMLKYKFLYQIAELREHLRENAFIWIVGHLFVRTSFQYALHKLIDFQALKGYKLRNNCFMLKLSLQNNQRYQSDMNFVGDGSLEQSLQQFNTILICIFISFQIKSAASEVWSKPISELLKNGVVYLFHLFTYSIEINFVIFEFSAFDACLNIEVATCNCVLHCLASASQLQPLLYSQKWDQLIVKLCGECAY